MISAPLPPDEQERVQLLHALNLLDTEADPRFDRITKMVSRLLNVPIALISLVDSQRQWFKSRVGLDAAETSRDVAFCAHAILDTVPLTVTDATLDERFADNPLVIGDPKVRFYAGVPIRTSGGLALGTLCAIDRKPRTLTKDQLDELCDLADMVGQEIRMREAIALSRRQLAYSQQVLEASEARFRSVFERASVGIALVAPNGGWISVNDSLCEIVGYSRAELARLTFQDITYPDDLDLDLQLLEQLVNGDIDHYQMEKRYIRKDGSTIWIALNVAKKTSDDGRIEYFIAIVKDIQARREAEEALGALRRELEDRVEERTRVARKREAELRMVIENANDAYVSIDDDGVIRAWNRQACETFGWQADEAIGRHLDELIIPTALRDAHRAGMHRFLASGQSAVIDNRIELPAIRRDGSKIEVEVRIRALKMDGQTVFSAFLHDITERRQMAAQREKEVRHDALTGLLNRRGLLEMLPGAIARSDRGQSVLGLLFLDLDGFKAVNDTHGHDVGDLLLKEVAIRLMACIRQTDTAVRLAGDEFTIVLEGLKRGSGEAAVFADRVTAAVGRPIYIGANKLEVGVSIGVAVHEPGRAQDGAALLRRADEAMYAAKRSGKGRVVVA